MAAILSGGTANQLHICSVPTDCIDKEPLQNERVEQQLPQR